MTLQDKTGTMEGKIWEPDDMAIGSFDALDFIEVRGDVSTYQGNLQVTIRRVRAAMAFEYDQADYLPISPKDNNSMFDELKGIIRTVENPWLKTLLERFLPAIRNLQKRSGHHLPQKRSTRLMWVAFWSIR